MKIYTELYDGKSYKGEKIQTLCMFLDTQKTGNPEVDTVNCAVEFNADLYFSNADRLLNLLIPTLSQLVYSAYGEPPERKYQKPIESIKDTGFDPTCVNGVKGCKLK